MREGGCEGRGVEKYQAPGGGGMRDAGREGGHECEGRVYG